MSNEDERNGCIRLRWYLWKMKNTIGITELALEFCGLEILRISQEISAKAEAPLIIFFELCLRYYDFQFLRFLLKLAHERIIGYRVKSWLNSWKNVRFFHHVLWNFRLWK